MNMNHQIKMKVLQQLKSHMDGKISQKLRSRKSAAPVMPQEEMKPPVEMNAPTAPAESSGLPDDDKERLMNLYSSLK